MNLNNWSHETQTNQFLPFLVSQSQIHGIYGASNNNLNFQNSSTSVTNTPQSFPTPIENAANAVDTYASVDSVARNVISESLNVAGSSSANGNFCKSNTETLVLPVENYQNNKEYIYRVKHIRSITTNVYPDDITKKELGPRCDSTYCIESKFRFCSTFTEDTRMKIFNEFWKNLNWDQRHIFVASHVFKKPKNSSQAQLNDPHSQSGLIFTLRNSNGSDEQVCQNMFLDTLCLTIERVQLWVEKYSIGGDGKSIYKEEFNKKLGTIKIYDPNDYDEKGFPKKKRKYRKKKKKDGSNYADREYDINCPNKPPREKHTIKPEYWKCNVAKKLRMEGKEYYSKNIKTGEMVLHKGKGLGSACKSKLCKVSKLRNCYKISEATRQKIFDNIWERWDWEQRKVWVASMVKRKPTMRKRTLSINSKRHSTLHYYLPDENGIPVQVCRKMFLETTGIGHHQTLTWTNSFSLGSSFEENIISTKDADNHTVDWIDALPKYNFGTKSEFKYIDPQFKGVSDLYKTYAEKCQSEGIRLTERYQFKRLVLHKKLRFVSQNDEECEKCHAFAKNKEKIDIDESFKYHKERIEKATAEKLKDQRKATSGSNHVLQIHLQPIKTVPILRNEGQIFKNKLQCNNLSIFDTKANYTTCYFFTEDQCPNMTENFQSIFSTIVCEHLKDYYLVAKRKLPIILYCNGNLDASRNLILSNALLNLATVYNVKITQKFYETGHSFGEDCYKAYQMHERYLNSKNKEIYLPSQLAKTMREIKRYPEIFTAIHLDFDFFRNYSRPEHLRYKSIHPGEGFDENDACEMQYHSVGKIRLKLDFNGESMDLLQKSLKDFKPVLEYPLLYTEMSHISKTKWDDLQDMKKFMPFDCQPFYDSLKYYED